MKERWCRDSTAMKRGSPVTGDAANTVVKVTLPLGVNSMKVSPAGVLRTLTVPLPTFPRSRAVPAPTSMESKTNVPPSPYDVSSILATPVSQSACEPLSSSHRMASASASRLRNSFPSWPTKGVAPSRSAAARRRVRMGASRQRERRTRCGGAIGLSRKLLRRGWPRKVRREPDLARPTPRPARGRSSRMRSFRSLTTSVDGLRRRGQLRCHENACLVRHCQPSSLPSLYRAELPATRYH